MRKRLRALCFALFCGSLAPPVSAQPLDLGRPATDGPVVVGFDFVLNEVNYIDEQRESFEFEALVTLRWRDPRQAFDVKEEGVPERTFQGDYQFHELFAGWWPQLVLVNESGGYEVQGTLLRIAPDGSATLVTEIRAAARLPMALRRFPFDRQHFEAVFRVLGYSSDEVLLEPRTTSSRPGIHIPQWRLRELRVAPRAPQSGGVRAVGSPSEIVVSLDTSRRPAHMVRVVIAPLVVLVFLTFSVFWMDSESLGDRMDISFTGLLSVVAYQIIVSDRMPGIAYFTLMTGFLYSTYLVLAVGVVMNLVVSKLDRSGREELGNLVDRRCRWAVPAGFVAVNLLSASYFLIVY